MIRNGQHVRVPSGRRRQAAIDFADQHVTTVLAARSVEDQRFSNGQGLEYFTRFSPGGLQHHANVGQYPIPAGAWLIGAMPMERPE